MKQMNLFMKQIDSDIENQLMVIKREREQRRDKLGVWDQQIQTTIYKIEKQQGPTVKHRKLYPISCDKPQKKRI